MDGSAPARVIRWTAGIVREEEDRLATEEPLEIRVRGRGISITMRTPGHDGELAAGFLLTEGIIHSPADIVRMEHCPLNESGDRLDVLLAPEVYVDFDRLTRHVFTSSSCGLCGKATIDAICSTTPPIVTDLQVDPQTLLALPQIMRDAQQTFDQTGGLHAAALFDTAGQLLVLREDVGRHNAVDKVIGHALLNRFAPLDHHILLVSGRTSFEILQKSLAARIPIVAAISAPSSLAVEFAQTSGQTLIGFLRGDRMNLYAHPHRINLPASSDSPKSARFSQRA